MSNIKKPFMGRMASFSAKTNRPRKPARPRGLVLGDRRTKLLDTIAKLVAETEKKRAALLACERKIESNEAAVAKAAAKVAAMAAKTEAAAAWARGD